MADMGAIASCVKELVREGFDHQFGKPRVPKKADAEWQKLRDAGTTLWLDTGDLEVATRLWVSQFEALTTNTTLLNKEVQKGIYDGLVGKAADLIVALSLWHIPGAAGVLACLLDPLVDRIQARGWSRWCVTTSWSTSYRPIRMTCR